MSAFTDILQNLPEVAAPTQSKLGFREKLKWTIIILVLFFVLGHIPLYGLGLNNLQQFEILSVILGSSFGSLMSLGIGPIVTASIVLQLLNGSGILKFDLKTKEGRGTFQGVQKLASIFFILFEAGIYVFMGGLAPSPDLVGTAGYFSLELVLVAQLAVGGLLVMLMDEVVSKWGFGSGISLFIAGGVAQSLFIRMFSPFKTTGQQFSVGALPALVQSLAAGDPQTAILMTAGLVSTILIFVAAVYAQAMKVEIPLSFGRVRGHGIRWPLQFVYTSNIPVILMAALLANIQLWANLLERAGYPFLGTFSGRTPTSGLVLWLSSYDIVGKFIKGSLVSSDLAHAAVYILFLIGGAVMFSWFWVQTSGMDARSQAENMMASGLQVPGFRRDARVLERLLERYIGPLTVMGAITVGLLAGVADVVGAFTNGTGLLLTVMIIYKLYEDIARSHMMDMHPALRKFMGG